VKRKINAERTEEISKNDTQNAKKKGRSREELKKKIDTGFTMTKPGAAVNSH
jgi:hypothetical protein